jgi:hypothetical protein
MGTCAKTYLTCIITLALATCGGRDEASGTGGSSITGLTGGGSGTTDGSGGGNTSMGVLDVGSGMTTANTTGDVGNCECVGVLDGIYVLAANERAVYFFDPPAKTFTKIGDVGCSAPAGWVANSMAIDRQGNAWFNYYNVDLLGGTNQGKLYTAPLANLGSCTELPYVQNPPGQWFLMGMGYSVIDPVSGCDELFLYNSDDYVDYPNISGGSQLAQWVEANNTLQVIGPTGYAVGELTGTGDGKLFAFAAISQGNAVLVNLDKDTGAEISNVPLSVDITQAFAFAFWGGDVYFFTETATGSATSKVWKLDYDNNEGGAFGTYMDAAGIQITGAGVSTCASFTPPG